MLDQHGVREARRDELHRFLLYAETRLGGPPYRLSPDRYREREGKRHDPRRHRARPARRRRQAADPRRHDRRGLHGLGRGAADQHRATADAIRIVAIANRTPSKAVAGLRRPPARTTRSICDSAPALARAIEAGRPAVTEDPMLVATSPHVDVRARGDRRRRGGARPRSLAAIEHGKHVVLMNAELDGTARPAPEGQGRQGRRRLHRRRRRPARRRAATSGASSRASASARCSAATSRACRTPTATRRPRRPSPSSGARSRTWSPPSPTAPRSPSSRRSSPTPPA